MHEWGDVLRAVADQRQFRAQLMALKVPMSYEEVEIASGETLRPTPSR